MSASAADGDVMAIAERLKAEAEHQLNVDGGRSLEIADRIYGLAPDAGGAGLGSVAGPPVGVPGGGSGWRAAPRSASGGGEPMRCRHTSRPRSYFGALA